LVPKDIFSHWRQIREGLISTIETFEEDELALIPFGGSWPIGRIMLHIADAEDGWLRVVVTKELRGWPDTYTLENYPDKRSILELLDHVHSRSIEYLAQLSESDLLSKVEAPWGNEIPLLWIIWHIIEHEIHHRGELSLILGYLGREGLDV
jgi:uncharacterized damage-inducible protein DinB